MVAAAAAMSSCFMTRPFVGLKAAVIRLRTIRDFRGHAILQWPVNRPVALGENMVRHPQFGNANDFEND
jgi:hypothetical protein